jgi:hypothetical protein
MMNAIHEITQQFLTEAQEDYVGLWSLVWEIRLLKELDPNETRSLVIGIIAELLHKNLIKAGIPNCAGEFEEWSGTAEEIVTRIQSEWDTLGKDPDIGDIVWFVSTE